MGGLQVVRFHGAHADFSRIGLRHRKAQNDLELPAKLLFKPFDVANLAGAIEAMRCLQADVRLYAAFAATRSIAIEGCKVDHVFQTDAAQRLSELLLGN